jgi:hypothetical protein
LYAICARNQAITLLAALSEGSIESIRNDVRKLRSSRYSNTRKGLALALAQAPEPAPKSLWPRTLALILTRTRQTRAVWPRPYYRTDRTNQGYQSIYNIWHSIPFITCHTSTRRDQYTYRSRSSRYLACTAARPETLPEHQSTDFTGHKSAKLTYL